VVYACCRAHFVSQGTPRPAACGAAYCVAENVGIINENGQLKEWEMALCNDSHPPVPQMSSKATISMVKPLV
jgi:hypothetical protein